MNTVELVVAISCLAAFTAFILGAESSLGEKTAYAMGDAKESALFSGCMALENFSAATGTSANLPPECLSLAKATRASDAGKKSALACTREGHLGNSYCGAGHYG